MEEVWPYGAEQNGESSATTSANSRAAAGLQLVAIHGYGISAGLPRSRAAIDRHHVGGPSNLVDPASSHMLVSKIKPCMSQCKFQYGRTVNGSLKQL